MAEQLDPAHVIAQLGYFTADGDPSVPEYNPGEAATCPACGEPLGPLSAERTKCRSFRVCNERSWFFYYHAACATEEGMKAVGRFAEAAVNEAFLRANPQ